MYVLMCVLIENQRQKNVDKDSLLQPLLYIANIDYDNNHLLIDVT